MTTIVKFTPQQAACLSDVLAEITRARAKHGDGFERADNNLRMVIITEEFGEMARALQSIRECSKSTEGMTTAEVLGQRVQRELHRENLRAEIVQSTALHFRWLLADQQGEG